MTKIQKNHTKMYNFKKMTKSKSKSKSKSIQKSENPVSKVLSDSLLKFNFNFQIQILCPKKSNFQGKLRKKTGQTFGDTHDGNYYKFSESIKNDRKALEL